jgi:2,4-dienoyl-CoA reductase-like NADH-dependent reductase (Old Yellow Enzyme family)
MYCSMSNLIDTIEAYMRETSTTATEFGREVMRDPNFVSDLRGGRDYRRSTDSKVRAFISANSPAKQGGTA